MLGIAAHHPLRPDCPPGIPNSLLFDARRLARPAALLAIFGLAGLALRLFGITGSLWLDEFGTLWTVEGSLRQVFQRSLAFHGQSPLYYLITWLAVRLFGESEVVLRLPALLFGILTAAAVYKLGREVGGTQTGLLSAGLVWLCFRQVEESANARPYTMATFLVAVMLLGFLRAAGDGRASSRLLFIAGGVGLLYSHYLYTLPAAGVAAAYFTARELRKRYSPGRFACDAAAQILLALPCLPQLRSLLERSGGLSWLGAPDYFALVTVAGPLLALAVAGMAGRRLTWAESLAPQWRLLWMAAAAPALFLLGLALGGTNLLEARYLLSLTVPASVLAARGILALPAAHGILAGLCWVSWNLFYFAACFYLSGSFSGAGRQQWRQALSHLEGLIPPGQAVPVLYRSGFVEEDRRPQGPVSEATLAPLRSPGRQPPAWILVPLTYRWRRLPLREQYFDRTVTPAIEGAQVFYLLSCENGPVDYPDRLEEWVEKRYPGRFHRERLRAARGIVLIHFRARTPQAPP